MIISDPTPILLASSSESMTSAYISVFWIALVALLSPLAAAAVRKKIPDVVFLLIFGILIGPHVLGLASAENGVGLLKELGLGLLFLLAGYEINTQSLRSKQGKSAALTWLCSFALGILVAGIITGFSTEFSVLIAVGIALSSTALGTLMPLLKSQGKSGTKLGDAFLVHGAIGELMPIFAMALLLSSHSPAVAVLILLGFMAIAILSAIIPHRAFERIPGLRRVMAAEANTTSQTMLRLAMLLLATLMMCAAVFELDVVLGAFSAGIILRSLTPSGAYEPFTKRLEVLGFSFLIPLFFVTSGMNIDISVAFSQPLVLLAIVLGILLIRGVPVFLAEQFTNTESGLTTRNERVQLGLYSAAGLPIIVAVTEVALSHNLLTQEMASLLVAAGALTILLFPIWAKAIDTAFPHKSDPAPADEQTSTRDKISQKKSEKAKMVRTQSIPVVEKAHPKDPAAE